MAAQPIVHRIVDSQLGSGFFLPPIEIRRIVYRHLVAERVHISLLRDKTLLSPCVELHPGGDYDGTERKATGDGGADTVWLRRLRSLWGPHWKCEELALKVEDGEHGPRGHTNLAMLLVCKRMYLDVVNFIAAETVFNVTSLSVLNLLSQEASQETCHSPSLTGSLYGFMASVSPHIRYLDVTLKLSLPMCMALENAAAGETAAGETTADETTASDATTDKATADLEPQLTAWRKAAHTISHLQQLRRLSIWLDHDQPGIWSTVNERALLSSFEPLARGSNLSMTINLPKLHPLYEKQERHFVESEQDLPFEIRRRLRQRYHAQDEGGGLSLAYEADFPITLYIPYNENRTLAEVEEWERSAWKDGVNVRSMLGRSRPPCRRPILVPQWLDILARLQENGSELS